MFDVDGANAIVSGGSLRVVRRTLFTGTNDSRESTNAFEAFYQHGSAIVLQSHGNVYLLTPSHVVRNATHNDYQNDSPVWASVRHEQPTGLPHYLMPTRFHDLSPSGDAALDAAVLEINPFIIGGLPDSLDWDNEDLFCRPEDQVLNSTAAVAGYPEETNPYEFIDQEDGSVVPVPVVRLTTFKGMISSNPDGQLVFVNFMHKESYQYAGLSGGVVVCAIGGELKYLGMVISRGNEGRRFKLVTFAEIRSALGDLRLVPWEVLDEAYFLGNPTHSMMTFRDLENDLNGRKSFVRRRSNALLEQLLRTMKAEPRAHWVCDFQAMHDELRERLLTELAQSLRAVVLLRSESPLPSGDVAVQGWPTQPRY